MRTITSPSSDNTITLLLVTITILLIIYITSLCILFKIYDTQILIKNDINFLKSNTITIENQNKK